MQQQPEMKIRSDGSKFWFLNYKLHHEDGPAVEYANGEKEWYLHGNLHREDGPAVEWPNGSKGWYLNGKCHREGGPAIEYSDGRKEWWLNGKEYSFEDYVMELERRGLKDSVVNTLFNIG